MQTFRKKLATKLTNSSNKEKLCFSTILICIINVKSKEKFNSKPLNYRSFCWRLWQIKS